MLPRIGDNRPLQKIIRHCIFNPARWSFFSEMLFADHSIISPPRRLVDASRCSNQRKTDVSKCIKVYQSIKSKNIKMYQSVSKYQIRMHQCIKVDLVAKWTSAGDWNGSIDAQSSCSHLSSPNLLKVDLSDLSSHRNAIWEYKWRHYIALFKKSELLHKEAVVTRIAIISDHYKHPDCA